LTFAHFQNQLGCVVELRTCTWSRPKIGGVVPCGPCAPRNLKRSIPSILRGKVRISQLSLAEHLIAKHPEHVNAKGGREITSIHVAVSERHCEILSLLIERWHDADVNNDQGQIYRYSTSSSAARLEGVDFYSIVVQISILETRLIILYATIGSHVEFARMLLKRGPVIDARNDGLTPLHWSARNGEK
jgi:hypothetical protein